MSWGCRSRSTLSYPATIALARIVSTKVLDAPITESEALARLLAGEPKGNPERDRGRSIPKIVNRIGEQRHAAGDEDDEQLQQAARPMNDHLSAHSPRPLVAIEGSTIPCVWPWAAE